MELPQPSSTLKRLDGLLGNFKSRETIHPNEHMPDGGVADTTCVGRQTCNGTAVVIDYEQKVGGKVMYGGHGVFRHNDAENVYELDWFDNMAPNATHFRGTIDGEVLILVSKEPNLMRLQYDFRFKKGFRFRMEVSADGINWKPMLDGDNVKVSMREKYAKKKKASPVTKVKKKRAGTKNKKTAKKKISRKKRSKKTRPQGKSSSRKKSGKKAPRGKKKPASRRGGKKRRR